LIALRRVTKRYGLGKPVLRDVELELDGGAVVVVEGPNGAGKSTLLRLVAGVSTPTAGRVDRARGVTVGYAPEGLALVPGLTGGSWLRQLGLVRGRTGGADVAAALGAVLDRPVMSLSHGQRQRIALAAAVDGEPDVVVLDEPTNGLDTEASAALEQLLRAAAGRGAAVVCAGHGLLVGVGRHLRVADGGLAWVDTPAPARVRVVGTGSAPAADAPGLVHVADGSDGTWVAIVEAGHSDAVLIAVLAAGASVREVGPAWSATNSPRWRARARCWRRWPRTCSCSSGSTRTARTRSTRPTRSPRSR
jgi:energy-coupling factor transporter ATP-binding protein EcfA2